MWAWNVALHENFRSNTYYNSVVTCHHNNVKSFSPTHAYIYVMNEGFKAEINAMMDVIMSAISNFKPTTFFLNFCSKVAYIHTYWRNCSDFMYLYPSQCTKLTQMYLITNLQWCSYTHMVIAYNANKAILTVYSSSKATWSFMSSDTTRTMPLCSPLKYLHRKHFVVVYPFGRVTDILSSQSQK